MLLSSLDRPLKIITFTSSLPGEGKSTSAVNFAVVLAQKGAKVLLVDADSEAPLSFQDFQCGKVGWPEFMPARRCERRSDHYSDGFAA